MAGAVSGGAAAGSFLKADEYRVPEVLVRAREARRQFALPSQRMEGLPPNILYALSVEAVAAKEKDGGPVLTALYTHAMTEAGYIGVPGETMEDWREYAVCPVCGYVFGEAA